MGERGSRVRLRIRALAERRWEQVQQLLRQRGGLIRGTFGVRRRVCGNPGCRCARGELHESKYLSVKVDGRTRLVHVPSGDELRVARGVALYSQWQRMCREIVQLDAEQARLIKELGDELLETYPPGDPIPPAGKRGRKPKDNSGGTGAAD